MTTCISNSTSHSYRLSTTSHLHPTQHSHGLSTMATSQVLSAQSAAVKNGPSALLNLPPEFRSIIYTLVFRHHQPITYRCPYSRRWHSTFCYMMTRWSIILGSSRANPAKRLARPRKKGEEPPALWSLILVNNQVRAETRGMLVALNTVFFPTLPHKECFRREHPSPIPSSSCGVVHCGRGLIGLVSNPWCWNSMASSSSSLATNKRTGFSGPCVRSSSCRLCSCCYKRDLSRNFGS